MLGWLVRLLLLGAGVIAGWFVPRDDVGFAVIQFVIVLVAIAAFSVAGIYLRLPQRGRGGAPE